MCDSKGGLWFGLFYGGIAYYNPKSQSFRQIFSEDKSRTDVRSFHEDKQGNIWVGTHGNGLFLLDKKERLFRLHTPESVLSGENIRVLGETPSGNLLIGTGHGLSVLEQKDGKDDKLQF